MKKILTIVLALSALQVFAQTPEELDRDRSKYATYSFSKDDKYHVEVPYETVKVSQPKGKKVKNVIFMIGDGTGLSQWSVGWVANGGALNIDNMPVAGYSNTTCTDRLVTDSCAGGTALAIGEKTKYGYIGCNEAGEPVESNLQYAKRVKGMKTGVTVTCRINDATPASTALPARMRKAWPPST